MIFRGPYPDVAIPEAPLTDVVLARAAEYAGKPALIDGATGAVTTYAQLCDRARRFAAGLAAHGFRKGDVLAIYSPNSVEYPIAYYGAASIGGILTTLNPLYTGEEVRFQLNDSGARFLLTIPAMSDKAREAAEGTRVEATFVVGESMPDADGEPPKVAINVREDLVALPYSSGTTGRPKGVMLTHYNLVASLLQIHPCEPIERNDTIIAVLPFFHIYGQQIIMNLGLERGATIVVMARFELEPFLKILQDYGVTRAHLVPPLVLALARHPAVANYNLSKLKNVLCGAAPLAEEVARECERRIGCVLRQGYGMTETSVPIALPGPAAKLTSVGVCAPNSELKIVNPASGEALSHGQPGEICVRGPQNMKGYLNRPEATAEMIDREGWLHTGDIGYVDEDGYVYVVDRVKELIKYKGLQVAPAELEALLLEHPAVADAAVIPSPDDEAGEVPKAFVVLKTAVETDAILAFVAARVAPFKKIRRIEVIDQIPKSPSGKILRRVLKDRDRAKVGQAVSPAH